MRRDARAHAADAHGPAAILAARRGRYGGMRTSVSMPAVRDAAGAARQADGSSLPQLVPKPQLGPRGRGVASEWSLEPAEGRPASNWPAKENHGGALAEIEGFLQTELSGLSAAQLASAEVRLQVHREAFGLFVAHFEAYATPLTAIKRAYETRLDELEQALSRGAVEHSIAHKTFVGAQQEITATLQRQLDEAQAELAWARREMHQASNPDVLAGDQDGSPAGGGGKGGGMWGSLQKAMDDPRAKVSRMLKAAERLCTTPELLDHAAHELLSMLPADHLCTVFAQTVLPMNSSERSALALTPLRAMDEVGRCSCVDEGMGMLSSAAKAGVVESHLLSLPSRQKERLLSVLLDAAGLSEPERLGLAREVLLSTDPLPEVAEDASSERPTAAEDAKNEKAEGSFKKATFTQAGDGLDVSFKRVGGDGAKKRGDSNGSFRKAGSTRKGDPGAERIRRLVFQEASRLVQTDGLLRLLISIWGDDAPERIERILDLLRPSIRRQAGQKVLMSSHVDALQLEQALEHLYLAEDAELLAANDETLAAEVGRRRHQSASARAALRTGKVPRLHASAARLFPLTVEDDPLRNPAGGLKLKCDCARLWVMPRELLSSVHGDTQSSAADERSIRRFEDRRFLSIEEREERYEEEGDKRRKSLGGTQMLRRKSTRKGSVATNEVIFAQSEGPRKSSKPKWHMSTHNLFMLLAEVWVEISHELSLSGAAAYGKLDPAARTWRKLLTRHGLKSAAQRALADLILSLKFEVTVLDECPPRLRMFAEMLGIVDDSPTWSEAKCHFFFWLLPLTLPARQMREHLVDPVVTVPLEALRPMLDVAVTDEEMREQIYELLEDEAEENDDNDDDDDDQRSRRSSREEGGGTIAAAGVGAGEREPLGTPPPPPVDVGGDADFGALMMGSGSASVAGSGSPRKIVKLDVVLNLLVEAWSDCLGAAVKQAQKKLLTVTRIFDENNDGSLDYNEFHKLVRKADIITSRHEVIPLYEATLAASQARRQGELTRQAKQFAATAMKPGVMGVGSDLASATAGRYPDTFTSTLPDAVDLDAFAEVVSVRTCTAPPEFHNPLGERALDDGEDSTVCGAAGSQAIAPRSPLGSPVKWKLVSPISPIGSKRLMRTLAPLARHYGAPPDMGLDAKEVERVVEALRGSPLIAELGSERLRRLTGEMERWYYPKGGWVTRQGEEAECAYILASGTASAFDAAPAKGDGSSRPSTSELTSEDALMSYDGLDVKARLFGMEMALPHAPPRTASVRLAGECVVYAMPRRLYRSALRRLTSVHLTPILRGVKPLCLASDDGLGPNDETIQLLSNALEQREFTDGHLIYEQGEAATTLYILLAGFAQVTARDAADDPSSPSRALPGLLTDACCFGESALFAGATYTASVCAVGYCLCGALKREVFEHMLPPSMMARLLERQPPAPDEIAADWIATGLRRHRKRALNLSS